jgi:hypothetical protein
MIFQDPTALKLSGPYYETVILPDEKRILFDEALKHMVVVDVGSVVGDRVDFIVDGRPTVAFEEWMKLWNELEGAK